MGRLQSQCGTLQQLQNAIGRRNVKKEPKDDFFNTCQDFFTLIVHNHILCTAMNLLKMEDLSSVPTNSEILTAGNSGYSSH